MRKYLATSALILLCWSQWAMAGTVLIVGDSISAAFGLDTEQGWANLLQKKLQAEGYAHHVINASISGDTTAGGRQRLPALLTKHQPDWLLLELGGNDGLRGQPLNSIQQNLVAMVEQAQQSGAQVMLLGMQLPPNYGPRYTQAFAELFNTIAADYQTALVPFFLENVGGVDGMMQADGIHPTAQAQPILLENAWKVLKERL